MIGLLRFVAALVLAPGLAEAAVPFVGCPVDGQIGPVAALVAPERPLPTVKPQFAEALAYYGGPSIGILAPRGWYCFDLYGSGGAVLIVTPEWHGAEQQRAAGGQWAGPGVVMEFISGENSGRFEVAALVARHFPAFRAFVATIVAMDLVPASEFPFGPYAGDRLLRRGARVVEFTTPAHTQGLGTEDKVLSDDAAVQGMVKIRRREFGMEARRVLVRLPPGMARLGPVIVRVAEAEAP